MPISEIEKIEISPKTLTKPQYIEITFTVWGITTNNDTIDVNSPNFISTNSEIIYINKRGKIFTKNLGAVYVFATYNDLISDSTFVIVNNYNLSIKKIEIFPKTVNKYIGESFIAELTGITFFNDTISVDISTVKSTKSDLAM